jgi:hypothetical protein
VRRARRDDGTCWLNIGDSYAGSWGAQSRGGPPSEKTTLKGNGHVGGGPKISALSAVQVQAAPKATHTGAIRMEGVKPKDLYGIPWMVAFALRADGWYLRQDIIWRKPNPMPESVQDRCTKAHEYVFLLSKSERYWFDAKAIAEPSTGRDAGNSTHKGQQAYEHGDAKHRTKSGLLAYVERQRSKRDSFKREDSKRAEVMPGQSVGTHRPDRDESAHPLDTRNKRSVWDIATQPFSEAHFATMAPELAETCIKAGCPIGGVVLDPFGGAGTTGLVADRLQREALLIELNPEYAAMAGRRIHGDAPLFADVMTEGVAA